MLLMLILTLEATYPAATIYSPCLEVTKLSWGVVLTGRALGFVDKVGNSPWITEEETLHL